MQLSEAISLIKTDHLSARSGLRPVHESATWADLGCGTGTFTLALAALLSAPSIIHAVDKDETALHKIPNQYNEIIIEKQQGDFVKDNLKFENLDGILMANALHYVKNKTALIQKLQSYSHENSCFLIVEYETDAANPWVPYPIRFQALEELFNEAGFNVVEKLGELPSRYREKCMRR